MLFPVAARSFHKDEQFLPLTRQRVDTLAECRRVVCAAVDENHAELLHNPANKRHAAQFLLSHDADHPFFRQGQQNPDGVGHAGVVGCPPGSAPGPSHERPGARKTARCGTATSTDGTRSSPEFPPDNGENGIHRLLDRIVRGIEQNSVRRLL